MPVELPQLNRCRFIWMSVCAVFPSDTAALESLFDHKDYPLEFKHEETPGSGCFIQFFADRFSDGKIHCHVNVAREDYFDNGDVPTDLCPPSRIEKFIDTISGQEGNIVIRGDYSFQKELLPKNGLPWSLDGMSAEVSGESLSISGVTVSISGFPYSTLKWKVDETSVSGTLVAALTGSVIASNYLVTAQKIMETGIERFLLEKEPGND